ncbi:ankyrin repeat-containing protein [Moniliophthora roreri]|nr:ankyrin repeat-containing protein [Moniliophthora roreri]
MFLNLALRTVSHGCVRLYQAILSNLLPQLLRIMQTGSALTTTPEPLVDEDLIQVFTAAEALSGSHQDVSSLPHLDVILLDVVNCLNAMSVQSSDLISGLCDSIEAIRLLLNAYHSNLLRASVIPGHRGVPEQSTQPNFVVELLEELLSCIKRIIVSVQRCRNPPKNRYLGKTPLDNLQDSKQEIELCLDNFQVRLNVVDASSLDGNTAGEQTHLLPKPIYTERLSARESSDLPLEIMKNATPARCRLVDCAQLITGILCIQEFVHFPLVPYATISYVWRGNSVSNSYRAAEFSVAGAEEADPIGVDVLHDACTAALASGASYLWIDRLCIMQTNKVDKDWQIREMYYMYRSCITCIVLPGGLRRLVPLDEETGWIHRGWTLQEALAPPVVVVLFAWKLGSCKARSGDSDVEEFQVVVQNRSAMASLSLLLDGCTTGYLSIELNNRSTMVEAKLFSAQAFNHSYSDKPFWRPTRRIMAPNISALAIAMSSEMSVDEKQWAIWQSALMRTSSRPVDMIYSIMGLFGVTLDTSAFHQNDRIGATIALAQKILERGGRANWLGVSFHVEPCPQLSTFPTFPRTRVSGKALVRVGEGQYREVSELMESEYPVAMALVPMPLGSMDNEGYLTFEAKAKRILPSPSSTSLQENPAEPSHITALDGSTWKVCANTEDVNSEREETWIVLLGFFSGYFPGATPAINDKNIRALLVERHEQGKLHIKSYFMLSSQCRKWVQTWSENSFCVGGPHIQRGNNRTEEPDEDITEITVVNEELLASSPNSNRPIATLKDQMERKARWAIPQNDLERHQREV